MKLTPSRIIFVAAVTVAFGVAATAASASEKVLHTFTAGKDGFVQLGSAVVDSAGNLYGFTSSGGADEYGVVFKLTPTASGPWKETILYHFTNGKDGRGPVGLAVDSAGNLYGVTGSGGKPAHGTPLCKQTGCGTIFRLSPNATGWTFNLLHSFTGLQDGALPESITLDASGDVFVTTFGSTLSQGGVFEMVQSASGLNGKPVYVFGLNSTTAGRLPNGPVVLDSAGNLYGTTEYGGTYGYGVVYELTPSSSGLWTESVLYSFAGRADGLVPTGGLTFDASGNLFGTADGGLNNYGVVFQLTPSSGGAWTETVLYTFSGGSDGAFPTAGLILDSAGDIYGTTFLGGTTNNGLCSSGCGVVYKLTPGVGQWTQTLLYSFLGGTDGDEPVAGPVMDSSGNLYSLARFGGKANSSCLEGCGVVFEVPVRRQP
jgi:uncharacterized repeat protein (TIGR03803 family)